MVRLRVAEILKKKGWSAYRLARESGLTMPAAYRLASKSGTFKRLESSTLERLCATLKVQPGDLLVWEPEGAKRRKGV